MLQSLVITLREGVEAALTVGIVLGYLQKTGRRAWACYVYWGLSTAVVASLVVAWVVHRLKVTEDAYEGWLMLASAAGEIGASPSPGPERRKLLAEQQRERFWKMSATAAGLLVVILISAQFIYSRTAQAMSPPEPIVVVKGEVMIPVSPLTDHKLHRYSIEIEGTEVRLIALLDATDTVRAALDACAICGSQGYYQDGKNVICRNCAAAINIPTIGVAGGCNPIHIDYRVEGDALRIPAAALGEARKFFH